MNSQNQNPNKPGYLPMRPDNRPPGGIPARPETRAFLGGVLGIEVNDELQPISPEGIVDLTFVDQDARESAEAAARSEEAAARSEENAEYYAEMAAQTAAESGYMWFYIDSDGGLYYDKTPNVPYSFYLEDGGLYTEVSA